MLSHGSLQGVQHIQLKTLGWHLVSECFLDFFEINRPSRTIPQDFFKGCAALQKNLPKHWDNVAEAVKTAYTELLVFLVVQFYVVGNSNKGLGSTALGFVWLCCYCFDFHANAICKIQTQSGARLVLMKQIVSEFNF